MNRCNCGSVTVITTQPCSQACSECFIPANYIVPVADRVEPCGGEGTINVAILQENISVCTGNTTYSVYSFSTEGFSAVSITAGGLLSYTLSADAEVGTYYEIVYRIKCDTGGYGGYGVIQITPEDLCLTANCTPSQTCNKCTGLCDDISIDLSVNAQ